jgi:hypothetical protein
LTELSNETHIIGTKEYEPHKKATDPITGGSIEIMRTVTHYYAGIAQIFYSPVKGIINTTTAIPRGKLCLCTIVDSIQCSRWSVPGVMNIIGSVSDGFHNVPRIYGSEVRERGPVNDFSSGITEGAKVGQQPTGPHTTAHTRRTRVYFMATKMELLGLSQNHLQARKKKALSVLSKDLGEAVRLTISI